MPPIAYAFVSTIRTAGGSAWRRRRRAGSARTSAIASRCAATAGAPSTLLRVEIVGYTTPTSFSTRRLDDLLALLEHPTPRVRGMDLLAHRARQALTALRPAQVPLPANPDSYASTTTPIRSRTPSLDSKAAT